MEIAKHCLDDEDDDLIGDDDGDDDDYPTNANGESNTAEDEFPL